MLLLYLIVPVGLALASSRRTPVNIYDKEPLVTALDTNNFDETIFNSSLASMVEFYAHWCGACRKIKPKIVDLARQSQRWHNNIIRVAAVNCGDSFNDELCLNYDIKGYPTLKMFGPRVKSGNLGRGMQVDSVPTMLHGMIDFVQEKFHLPSFRDFTSKKLESIFGSNKNAKYGLLIIEEPNSYFGKMLILDFLAQQSHVVIKRATPESNPTLATQLQIDARTALPKVYLIQRMTSVPEPFSLESIRKIRPALDLSELENDGEKDTRTRLIRLIEKLIESKDEHQEIENESAKTEELEAIMTEEVENDEENILDQVYMRDLESGLNWLIRSDIAHAGVISGHKFAALKEWIRILDKYFPGRPEVKNYIKNLKNKLDEMTEISGSEWRNLADEKTVATLLIHNLSFLISKLHDNKNEDYLPNHIEWFHCRGSQPEFRGYPCSLWTIFHVLSVAQLDQEYAKSSPFQDFNVKEVIEGIKLFVNYFFTCKECSENFARETNDYASHLDKPTDAVIYLWKIHNKVNRRLANEKDQEQDPQFPKVLFPTKVQCPKCHLESDEATDKTIWNLKEVLAYLTKYYSASNLVPIEETIDQPEIEESRVAHTSKIMSALDEVFSLRSEASRRELGQELVYFLVIMVISAFRIL